jgi:hypothetical protein
MKATSAWRCVKGVVPWEGTSKPKPSPRSNGLHRAHPLRLQLLAVVGCVLCGEPRRVYTVEPGVPPLRWPFCSLLQVRRLALFQAQQKMENGTVCLAPGSRLTLGLVLCGRRNGHSALGERSKTGTERVSQGRHRCSRGSLSKGKNQRKKGTAKTRQQPAVTSKRFWLRWIDGPGRSVLFWLLRFLMRFLPFLNAGRRLSAFGDGRWCCHRRY